MEDKKNDKINVVELFGSNVFNDKIMQERLPKKVYKELHKTIDEGKELDPITAEVVAGAMKDWAVEKVQRIIRTGSSRLPDLLLRNMMHLSRHLMQMEPSVWIFPEKS